VSDLLDIAARKQRLQQVVDAFTPPTPTRYARLTPFTDSIVELRQKGASLRLIREILATIDVCVSIDTIGRFLAEVDGATTPRRRAKRRGERRNAVVRPQTLQAAASAPSTELLPATQQSPAAPTVVVPSERMRTRGPRIADPRNL